jgi:hypothetical protein
MQSHPDHPATDLWQLLAPLVDDAIADLGQKDRNAILLRYVNGKDYREISTALNTTEAAAQVRVSRAVEKLRKIFARRGVALSSGALTGAIAANSVQAAPVGLAASVAVGAVNGTALTASTLALVKGTLNVMAWTKLKIAAGIGAAALIAYQWHEIFEQKNELAAAQAQLQQERQQVQELRTAIDDFNRRQAAAGQQQLALASAAAKMIANERSAAEAARAEAADAMKNSANKALGDLVNGPANKELASNQIRQTLRFRYSPLAQKLGLSPETTDQLFGLIIDNEMHKKDILAGLVRGDIDVTTALADRDGAAQVKENRIRALLGDSGYAQFDDATHAMAAGELVTGLNRELGDKALNDEQSQRMQALFGAKPDTVIDDVDLFRSTESLDALFQSLVDRGHADLEKSSSFLTPEQLAAAYTIQSNYFNSIRTQLTLGQRLVRKSGR